MSDLVGSVVFGVVGIVVAISIWEAWGWLRRRRRGG